MISEENSCVSVVVGLSHHLYWAMADDLCAVKTCWLEVKQAYSQTVRENLFYIV